MKQKPKKHTWRPTPRMQDFLASLRPGEVVTRNRSDIPYNMYRLKPAAEAGYIKILVEDWRDWKFKRTDKPLSAWKPKPPRDGIWPWGLEEHWRKIDQGPARIVRNVAERVGGTLTDVESTRWPLIVGTRSELQAVRNGLEKLAGIKTIELGANATARERRRADWLPRPLLQYGRGGILLRMLFLDILAEPVFENARVVRFRGLEPDEVWKEQQQLLGEGDEPMERYYNYLHKES
jgi:hypothetical protein